MAKSTSEGQINVLNGNRSIQKRLTKSIIKAVKMLSLRTWQIMEEQLASYARTNVKMPRIQVNDAGNRLEAAKDTAQ